MSTTYTSYGFKPGAIKQVTATGALTLVAGDTNTEYILDAAGGATITLPALAPGLYFKFRVGAAFASTNWVIDSAEGDNINGIIVDIGSTPAAVPASGEDQVNFVASAETIGDWVELVSDYDNSQWLVTGVCGANGGITVTDPS